MALKNSLTVKCYHHTTFNHVLTTCSSARQATITGKQCTVTL